MTRLVQNVCDILTDENELEQSKYAKVFKEANGEWKGKNTLGVYAAGLEKLSKKKGIPFKKFPRKTKMDDTMKSTSKTFTKGDSMSSSGRGNTCSKFCCLILINSLSLEAKHLLKETLKLENIPEDEVELPTEELDENEYMSSQTFPGYSQSQGHDILQKCQFCDFLTRDRAELSDHQKGHAKCELCHITLENEGQLQDHMKTHRTKTCEQCNKEVNLHEYSAHIGYHKTLQNFRKNVDNPKIKKDTKKSQNCYILFCKDNRERIKTLYPSLTNSEITKKLGEAWKLLSDSEKAKYKTKSNMEKEALEVSTVRQYGEATEQPEAGQSTLLSCEHCGIIYVNVVELSRHILMNHGDLTGQVHVEAPPGDYGESNEDEEHPTNEENLELESPDNEANRDDGVTLEEEEEQSVEATEELDSSDAGEIKEVINLNFIM